MTKILPESYLKCLSASERKSLGKAGLTKAEALAKAEAKSEKELHQQCVQYLRMKGIQVFDQRMDRRSRGPVGWPDLTFAVAGCDKYGNGYRVFACAFEIKLPKKSLDAAQQIMQKKLQSPPNHWTHRTITSLDDLKAFLDALL